MILPVFLVGACSSAPQSDPYTEECGSAKGYSFDRADRIPPGFENDYLENVPIESMECRAAAGDYYAQYNLGRLYLEGKRVELDYKKARALFRAAGSPTGGAGNFSMQSAYGFLRTDVKSPQRPGFAPAQYALGLMIYSGLGGTRDVEEGLGWIRKAAEQGNREARAFLEKVEADRPE